MKELAEKLLPMIALFIAGYAIGSYRVRHNFTVMLDKKDRPGITYKTSRRHEICAVLDPDELTPTSEASE